MKIVILAGGGGTRLYPLSSAKKPKQFLPLGGKEPLIVSTIKRFTGFVNLDDIVIVTGKAFFSLTKKTLKAFGLEKVRVACEPCAKNTAPAVILGVKFFLDKKSSGSEIFLVVPSDHLISPEDKYLKEISSAAEDAEKGRIVLFGKRPQRAETGFGYIRKDKNGSVLGFKEKPALAEAERLVADGGYFWNMGMFMFSAVTLEIQLYKFAPCLADLFALPYKQILTRFDEMPSVSFDCAVAEKSDCMTMKESKIKWSDIGSWDAFYDYCKKDENGNVLIGGVVAEDCKNCLVASYDAPIKAVGLTDTLMICSGGVTIAIAKGRSQEVKKIYC